MPQPGSVRYRRQGAHKQRVDRGNTRRSPKTENRTTQGEQLATEAALDSKGVPPEESLKSTQEPCLVSEEDGERPLKGGCPTAEGPEGLTQPFQEHMFETGNSPKNKKQDKLDGETGQTGVGPLDCSGGVDAAAAHAPAALEAPQVVAPTAPTAAGAHLSDSAGPSRRHESDREPTVSGGRSPQSKSSAWVSVSGVPSPRVVTSGSPSSPEEVVPLGDFEDSSSMDKRGINGSVSSGSSSIDTAANGPWALLGSGGDPPVSVVCAGDAAQPKFQQMSTSRVWLVVFSVLLTWVQDPLLSLLASAAAARIEKGGSLAVVGVGAGGQVPDGVCLLLVALGLAVGALCSRSSGPSTAKGFPSLDQKILPQSRKTEGRPEVAGALRVAAVGAWLAGKSCSQSVGSAASNFSWHSGERRFRSYMFCALMTQPEWA